MAQQGEAAKGLCGCASERPTGSSGERDGGRGRETEGEEGKCGRGIHPSLASVCFLFAAERGRGGPFINNGLREQEEDRHEEPVSAMPSLIFSGSVCVTEHLDGKH